jgi:hypothetical protein
MEQTTLTNEILERLPVDLEGSSAFQANSAHLRTLKICLTAAVALALLMGFAALQAISRPPQVAVIRVDDVRGAELVRVGEQMDIRTAEVRTALWHWCIWRYRILKSSARQDFAQSYYFLASDITTRYRDSDAKKVGAVLANTDPEQTVDVRSIAIPPLKVITAGAKKVLSGRAQIELVTSENLNAPADSHDPTRRKWLVNLEFVIDPRGAAEMGKNDPQSQIVNPLGITITGYYETQEASEGH